MKNYFLILVAALFFLGCQSNNFSEGGAPAPQFQKEDGLTNDNIGGQPDDIPVIERQLIKTGSVSFKTGDIQKTAFNIKAQIKKLNGYISSESSNDFDHRLVQEIQVRIPAEHFDSLIYHLTSTYGKLESKNITISDVTEEYLDIQARIKTKKELEARYFEILKQAKNVSEILQVEEQLNKVRTVIETAEGRLRYLKNKVGFSTLDIYFYTEKSNSFFLEVGKGLTGGWEGFKTFLIGLTYLWPFLILVALGVWFIVRYERRRRQKKNS